MLQRLGVRLPAWAHPTHPVLRYRLKVQHSTRRRQLLRALGIVLLLVGLTGGGYFALLRTEFPRPAPGQYFTESLLIFVFWPALAVQILLRLGAQALTINTVSEEKRRQTWDSLRATEHGAELTLRTRWALTFYRLRWGLATILLIRLILIGGILFDLTAFRGGYLDRLINGIVPGVPVLASALLLAFMMTASLLLPLISIGFDAAVGLLVSTTLHQRTYVALAQILLAIARLVVVGLLILGMMRFTLGALAMPDVLAWLLLAMFAAMGDWGLAYLQLGFYGELWAAVPYAIFMGIGLLVFALFQAALTDWMLALAIRRAERSG